MMVDGIKRVIEPMRSGAGLLEAAVRLAVESAAVKWCAFVVAHDADATWIVVHNAGGGAPAAGTVLSEADVASLDPDDPDISRVFRCTPAGGGHARRTGVIFARRVPAPRVPCGAAESHTGEGDRLDEALGALFAHLDALLAVVPEHSGRPDDIPGLMAEAQIRARLNEELARAERYGGALSVLLIDVDATAVPRGEATAGGGAIWREVQTAAVRSLGRYLRQMDVYGRHAPGGFLVILPETGAEEALNAGGRLGELIGRAVAESAGSPERDAAPAVELRCGVATFPVAAQSSAALLEQAETALRAARTDPASGWLRHASPQLGRGGRRGFQCICRRCGRVFEVDDRAHQRARRFCSHGCYVADRRETEQGRDEAIREARAAGASLRDLARRHGLSAERVRQICQRPPA